MKVVIVAGGTGGHFYPGLAVAHALRDEKHTIRFIIKKKDYVIPLLVREEIPFTQISATGFKRAISFSNFLAPFRILSGCWQSFCDLRKDRPQVLLVMGGYLSFAPAVAARLLGIPVILHEQNVIPGLANRVLSILAKKVAVSFKESAAKFSGCVVTGNPIRSSFSSPVTKEEARQTFKLDPAKKTLFVFGGSQGAHALNSLILDVFKSGGLAGSQVLHIPGPYDEAWVRGTYEKLEIPHFVAPFSHEMARAFWAADVVLCRSGASTISELIVTKKAALLVPYPFATANHQLANARVLGDIGAAHVKEEKELTEETLKAQLETLMNDDEQRRIMEEAYATIPTNPLAASQEIKNLAIELAKT